MSFCCAIARACASFAWGAGARLVLLGLLATGMVTTAPAEGPRWTVTGEHYLRADARAHATAGAASTDFRKDVDNDNRYLYARTTLGLDVADERWNARVAVRDNRTLSDEREPSPRTDHVDLFEAYLEWAPADDDGYVRAGRQQIAWGSWLLLGTPLFNNGRTFDAITASYPIGGYTLQAAAGWHVPRDRDGFNETDGDDRFAGLALDFGERVKSHVYLVGRDTSPELGGGARSLYTIGWWGRGTWGAGRTWEVEAAWQGGSREAPGGRTDHRSWHLAARADQQWKTVPGKPRLGLAVLASPGDDDPTDEVSETWDLFYSGGNHRRAGRFDVVGWRNMVAMSAHLRADPAPGWVVQASWWRFHLETANDLFYAQGGSSGRTGGGYGRRPEVDTRLGDELDFWVSWKPRDDLDFMAELSWFRVGSYIEDSLAEAGGAQDAVWASLRTRFRF